MPDDDISMDGHNGQTSNLPPLSEVEERINQLHETIAKLQGQAQTKSVKIKPPEAFNGTRSNLQGFLTQLELYMRINREKLVYEEDKVLFATSYLTGAAFDWFEPIIRDYQEYSYIEQDKETRTIFGDFQQFKKHLQGTFGDIDTERNAERRLKRLRQTKLAQAYSSEFIQISSHTSWSDDVLMSLYEDGLKTEIQEKLIWMDRPKTLGKYIGLAVKIDNKLYDFNARKKGFSYRKEPRTNDYRANDKRPFQRRNQQGYEDPYGLQLMELDATQQPKRNQQRLSAQEEERRKREKFCFAGGKSGHMSRDCRQRQRNRSQQQTRNNERAQLSATEDRGAYETTRIIPPELRATTEDRVDGI